MLIQFSVENFKSIKNKVTLSFEASKDRAIEDNYVALKTRSKERILKTIAIYGANASGKSNIFSSLTAAILTIRNSNLIQADFVNQNIVPFKFSSDTNNSPSSFEFVFIAEDGYKYIYRFSTTSRKIESEELYVYFSSKATRIFKRESGKYVFFTSYERKLKPIAKMTANNKLFLATATAWNCKETAIPFNWFANKINTYSNRYENVLHISGEKFENDKDNQLKNFTKQILKEADINIFDYDFSAKEIKGVDFPNIQNIPFSGFPVFNVYKEYKIKTIHKVDDNKEGNYELDFSEESLGTRSLFLLSPILKNAFEKGEVVCIDEFDASLHPLLTEHIVSLFNNPNLNKSNAQLVFSAHTAELMNLKNFRRDQIYFVNKDRATAITELYSLDEFSVRKSDKIRKEYLLGRYDAIPNITPMVLE